MKNILLLLGLMFLNFNLFGQLQAKPIADKKPITLENVQDYISTFTVINPNDPKDVYIIYHSHIIDVDIVSDRSDHVFKLHSTTYAVSELAHNVQSIDLETDYIINYAHGGKCVLVNTRLSQQGFASLLSRYLTYTP